MMLQRKRRPAPPPGDAWSSRTRAILGAEHPLVCAEDRVRWLGRQVTAVVAALAVCIPGVVAGAREATALAIASAGVGGALLLALAGARACVRTQALAVITSGRGHVPLMAVQRERSRLLDPRHRHALARAIDDLRDEAGRPYARRPLRQPLYTPAFIRALDRDLAEIATLLRTGRPDITAVARIERLLGGVGSPLYGRDLDELRHELRHILRVS